MQLAPFCPLQSGTQAIMLGFKMGSTNSIQTFPLAGQETFHIQHSFSFLLMNSMCTLGRMSPESRDLQLMEPRRWLQTMCGLRPGALMIPKFWFVDSMGEGIESIYWTWIPLIRSWVSNGDVSEWIFWLMAGLLLRTQTIFLCSVLWDLPITLETGK